MMRLSFRSVLILLVRSKAELSCFVPPHQSVVPVRMIIGRTAMIGNVTASEVSGGYLELFSISEGFVNVISSNEESVR